MKRYMNGAMIYAVLAMVGGVFYREFTKIIGFTGETTLSVVHTHYFVLGMVMMLLFCLFEHQFHFTNDKTNKYVNFYHIGLNLTCVMFMVRGLTQALALELSSGANAAISGIAGVGHIILGLSLVFILNQLKKALA